MKQTEIGLIPDDWEVKEIKDFADVTTGDKNTQDAEENGKYPFYVRSPIVERINKFSYDTEGVITAGDGVGTGKVFHYAKGKFGLHQRAYLIYNFKNTNPKYFYYNFSKNFYERVHSMTAKSSVDSVRREMITKMQIPIPPTLDEQQRIAKALSDVDALISTTEKLIKKKKNIKQGTMQNLLTGKKRLPGFGPQTKSPAYKQTELGLIPEDWEVKSLNEYIDNFIVPMRDKPTDLTGQIPWCRIEDFDGKYLSESKTNQGVSLETIKKMNLKIFPVNTLLVSCSANLGKCAIVSKDLITNQTFIGLVPNKTVNVEYLFYKMSFEENRLNEMATGTTISYLSREQFEKYEITTPPTKEEQSTIANVLSCMDKEIETLNTKLEKYRNLKTAMMQQLLTGKIRLK